MGPKSSKFGPNSNKLGPNLTVFDQNSPILARFWSNLGHSGRHNDNCLGELIEQRSQVSLRKWVSTHARASCVGFGGHVCSLARSFACLCAWYGPPSHALATLHSHITSGSASWGRAGVSVYTGHPSAVAMGACGSKMSGSAAHPAPASKDCDAPSR